MTTALPWRVRCVKTGAEYDPAEVRYRSDAGALLEVVHDLERLDAGAFRETSAARLSAMGGVDGSGVWRYRELVLPVDPASIVTLREGNTPLYCSERLSTWTGLRDLALKHEGQNPTGSFKDRGMASGVTAARVLGQTCVACASTGNTSASLAAYAAAAGMRCIVFIPHGGIALGKLAQAVAYGAAMVAIRGNFDDAMRLVEAVCGSRAVYLLNSINPYRIEGQKTIGFEIAQELGWSVPDWIVVPGGNLGNSSAIYKGLEELLRLGVIDRLPRMAVIQAAGAAPLYEAFAAGRLDVPGVAPNPRTIASAIRIGAPVSWPKCVTALRGSNGVVAAVSDEAILAAKHEVDGAGIGAEPASCASIAGLRALVRDGVIDRGARVVCVLTGHVLKDPEVILSGTDEAGRGTVCDPDLDEVARVVDRILDSPGIAEPAP